MASRNKVDLIGRVGGDPETRYMPNGDAVTNISLATSERWKDKQTGEPKEVTEWHRVVFFGKVAEIVANHVQKGSQIAVIGKLKTRKWQDQQGQDRYTTEVVVDSFNGELILLGGKPQNDNQAPRQQPQQRPPAQQRQSAPQQSAPAYDSFDDDIPF